MIIGSDPCKLLAELLSPAEGGRVRGQGSSVGSLRCQRTFAKFHSLDDKDHGSHLSSSNYVG